MDRHFSTSVKEVSVPWVERQTLKTLGRFLPRAARERQIHEWQDQLECTRAVNGDLGRELMQMVRSTPSLAWTAVPSVFRVSLPPLATAIMAALILWPAGRTPLPAGNDYAVRLWDARTHKQLGAPLIGHTGPVMRVAFSRDGRTLASASEDGTVRLWDARTHKQIGPPLIDNIGPIRSLGFSADGRTLTSVGEDGTVRLWLEPKKICATRTGDTAPARS
ncbi:MAG TPA: hypothetical protein VG106_00660, partial [Vicinamibacterales bacterium]|nr:hypothetical protein [Vicinamibacterales bacterium]